MTHAAAALPAPAHGSTARALARGRGDVFAGVALAFLGCLVFANALANGFVLDDRGVILGNRLVQNLGDSWRAFASPYWPEALGTGQYRPLAILHFAFDWRVSGGGTVWFHAANVAWHAGATLLAWRLAAQLMRPAAALLCAALFAVHPVHVEAVANVVGRLELMAAVFALGALLAHRASSWIAVPLFALGLLSKENAIVTIGLIVANDLLLRPQTSDLRPLRRLYAGYAAVLIVYAATLFVVFNDRPFHVETGTLTDASLTTRLWTMASVIPHYVRLLVFPAALSADYEPQVIPVARGLTPAAGVGLVCLTLYCTTLVVAWKRNRTLAFALAWIAIALAPVANLVFVSGVTLAERSLYLPSVGAMLALGMVADAMWERRRAMVLGAASAICIAGAVRTWTRTPTWRDDRSYTLTLLNEHPESYRAHWVAGRVHRASGRLADASREMELARRLYNKSPILYKEAADVALRAGQVPLAAALRDTAATLERGRGR